MSPIRRRATAGAATRGTARRGTVRGYAVASWIVPGRFSYVAILVFVLVGCLWLEIALRTRVFARPLRLLLTVLPVAAVFYLWDAYAVAQGHWFFDVDRILGLLLPAAVPVDEILFFLTIPLAAILTLEAVRSVRGWPAGDEPEDVP